MATVAGNLKAYKAKRNFSITSEPAEGGKPSPGKMAFVVQKHWATRLHYDFRLELDGTMKSWAVPKGPSYDPHDKRIAVQVEDHPISYNQFEGTIPPKQYGAGKVIIWDKGTWVPKGDPQEGLRKGNLKFELRGHKLLGEWALVRLNKPDEKRQTWLLIKERDGLAKPAAEFSVVDEYPDSVKALGLPKDVLAAAARADAPPPAAVPAKAARGKASRVSPAGALPAGAVKAVLPDKLAPQLATLVDGPPADAENWVFEIKFDGYRLLVRVEGANVQLITRNGHDWTERMKALHTALKAMKLPNGWYDGEIVVLNSHGLPDFGLLQNAFDDTRTQDIVLYLFDIPYFDGHDLRQVPLRERRALLQATLERHGASHEAVRLSQAIDAPPQSIVASACQMGLEGVIGKRADAPYRATRSADWIKLKCSQRQEFVIGGWTDPQGSRTGLGSLLLGYYDDMHRLVYAGKVGSGFNERTLKEVLAHLQAVAATKNPFEVATDMERRPHWAKPVLVAEVTFGEWTHSGHVRHAVFHGLRTDKPAASIVREKAASAPKAAKAPRSGRPVTRGKATGEPSPQEALASHALSTKLRVTNPDRVIDAGTGITKVELVRYYSLVGDLMMEHLKDRPVAMVRAPSGIAGQLFFQKHVESEKLQGIAQLDPALYPGHPAMLKVASKDGLLFAAQWNVVEFHTLNTLDKTFEFPNRIIFDLDPGEGVAWPMMQEGARAMKIFLDQLGLPAFLKTSGGKGLHVVVPIKPVHSWDEAKGFSEAIVVHLAKTLPQMFVAKSGPRNRVGRIFIDYLRNGVGASTVAGWSARARPGMGISVPVDWSELAALRGGDHWTIRSAQTRLDAGNVPWAGYLKASRTLNSAMKTLGFSL